MATRIHFIFLSFVAAAAYALIPPSAHAGWVPPSVAGPWQINGTPAPNECGVDNPFVNFSVISRDGTMVNTDPAVGTSVGEVFRLSRLTYGVGFFGFIAPAPGVLLKYEVQGTLRVRFDGTANGRFRTIVSDVAGVGPSCIYEGTIDAQKLSPLPY